MKIHSTANPAAIKLLVFAMAWLGARLAAESVHDESAGLVIMEAENTASPLGLWHQKTSLSDYTGRGYLEFTGNDYVLGEPHSPLSYHFKINRSGAYVLDLRCAKMNVNGHHDWANDCYVRMIGDFTAEPGQHDIPGHPASLHMLKTDMKYYGGAIDAWEWATGDLKSTGGRLDPGGKNNKRLAIYHFKAGETYTLVVTGRSKSFRLDRIILRHRSEPMAAAHDASKPESARTGGRPPAPDDMDVAHGAVGYTGESHPGSDGVVRKHGAAVEGIQAGSWIAFKDFDFGAGNGGAIDLKASSAGPGGRVEIRTDAPTGTRLGAVAIRKTGGPNDYTLFSGPVAGARGKKELYLVFLGASGELFNLAEFTFRSGEAEPVKPATPPIRPPAGRLAYVADGNSPDPDDIGGTAAALAMLRATGLDHRLVHLSHSCDLVVASNISAEQELKRQEQMQTACDGTVRRWGGFKGLTAWNCRTQQTEAVHHLRDQINASSAADPLWIIEAGEPDIIGFALEAADAAKRKHVKLVTHHPVNDGSGDYFKWDKIAQLGIEVVRIPDQNGGSFADIGKGLQRPLWAFYWARDHADSRVRWLWEQVKIAEEDRVVGFQKNKCDISDAGMMFYWITGADQHDGYRTPTMDDVIDLLEPYLRQP
jgi:hypothetical protein